MRKLLITLAICLVIGGVAHATPTAGVNTPPTVYGTCMGYQPGIGGDFCLNNGAQSFWQQFTGDVKNIRGTPQCSPTNTTQCGKLTVQGLNGIPLVGSLGDNQFWCFNLASGNMVPCTGGGGGGGGPINTLPAQTGDYDAHTFRLTDVGVGTTIGDTLEFGLNHLNDLAPATGVYSMNGNKIQGLAAATVTNDAIAYGQAAAFLLSATITNAAINNILTVSVPPYNAAGNGSTDDLSAIQDAIYDACTLPTPPTGNPLARATKKVYLPVASTCYLHSKPIRIPCANLEVYGDGLQSKLCQSYVGDSVIQNAWGNTTLHYGTSLATGAGNALVSADDNPPEIDIGRFINGPGTNNFATVAAANGFNIAFFVNHTGNSGGDVRQIFASTSSFPGSGNGAFKFNFSQPSVDVVSVSINTTGGALATITCGAQTLNQTYEMELDWDKTNYRVFQGIPGSPSTLCGTDASSNPPAQGAFEVVALPPHGAAAVWPQTGNGGQDNAFLGSMDSVRISKVSQHTASYTTPTTKFTPDSNTYYLTNFETSLDGTQIGYTGASGIVYSTVTGTTIGFASGGNLHDFELCSQAQGGSNNQPNGLWAAGANNSRWNRLTCSNAYYSGFMLANNDYFSTFGDNLSNGGRVGLTIAGNSGGMGITNNDYDGPNGIGEVYQDGNANDQNTKIVDRDTLIYGLLNDNTVNSIISDFQIDSEVSNSVFIAPIFNNSTQGTTFINGGIASVNSSPYVISSGGQGPTFIRPTFGTPVAGTPPEIFHLTGTAPSPPIQLINPVFQTTSILTDLTPDSVQIIDSIAIPNASSTGTSSFHLAKLTGAPSMAVSVGTTDTVAIGVVVTGGGTTGTATIKNEGTARCAFDATGVVSGDFVQISTTTAGDCHDSGVSSYTSGPPSGFVVGTALETGAGSANRSINIAFAATPSILANYGHITNITNAASPYSVLGTDYFISCNATAGATTITLPLATATGRQIIVKKSDASANACTISRQGADLIDGATTAVDAAQYQSFSVMDAGSAVWSIF